MNYEIRKHSQVKSETKRRNKSHIQRSEIIKMIITEPGIHVKQMSQG